MNRKKPKSGETSVGKPPVEKYFIEELELIDRRLKVVWHSEVKKFLIVTPAPHQLFNAGYVVEMVVEDENGNYAPCDRRILGRLIALKYDRDRNFKQDRFLDEMDRDDFQKAVKAETEGRLRYRDFLIKVNKFLRTKTFVLNGGKQK